MWPQNSRRPCKPIADDSLDSEPARCGGHPTLQMRPNRHRFLNAFIHPQPRSNASASRRRCLRLKPIGVYLIIAIVVASVTVIVIAAVFFSRHHDEVSEIKVVVDLAYAQYEGRTLSNGVSQWLGIRYGQNPVGDLRFRDAKEPLYASGLQSAVKVYHTIPYPD